MLKWFINTSGCVTPPGTGGVEQDRQQVCEQTGNSWFEEGGFSIRIQRVLQDCAILTIEI